MSIRPVCLSFFALSLMATPCRAEPDEYAQRMDEEAVGSVLVNIEHKNCEGAVKALNKGLAAKHPGVMLMAASMFEGGLCVKQNWDKAAVYYQMAHAAGRREALPRLISGYAENNRDPGAALWWLTQLADMPAACKSANHLVNDPEAFVAALNKWPQGQIAGVVYTGAVTMRVIGDVEFPARGAQQGVFGDAVMHFVPATGTITWTAVGTDRVNVSREVQVGEEQRSVFADIFLKHMRAVSDRALKQFVRPESINPAWVIDRRFSFSYRN